MDNPPDGPAPPEPEPSEAFLGAYVVLLYLLIPVALFTLGRYGWNRFGALGLIVGLLLAIPIASVSVGLLAMTVLGVVRVFDPDTYRRLNGTAPPPEDRWPPAPATPEPIPPARRGQVRILVVMAAIAVLAVCCGVGAWCVRASADELGTALGMALIPLWIAACLYAVHRIQRWFDHTRAEQERWKAKYGGRP